MSYTKNELAEQAAMRDITNAIIGGAKEVFSPEAMIGMVDALQENEAIAVDLEQYHLAEVFRDVARDIIER